MQYYKVKAEFDNFIYNKKFDILVANELYTAKEFYKIRAEFIERYGINKFNNFKNMFDIVNVNKNKTYFSFGTRFY